jgi:hypothetical protein
MLEEGRSTALLPQLTIQVTGRHAMVNTRQSFIDATLAQMMLRKGHKCLAGRDYLFSIC